MNKITKSFLQFMLAFILFASFALASCNNDGDKAAETPKDSVKTEKPMEAPPAAPVMADTTQKKDTAKTRPLPPGH